jgi:hypothetical protein
MGNGVVSVKAVLRQDGHVRRDDHQLVRGLSGAKLIDQPLKSLVVESAGGVVGLVRSLHRIVQHNKLDRYIGLRYEAVTGMPWSRLAWVKPWPTGFDVVSKNSCIQFTVVEVGLASE